MAGKTWSFHSYRLFLESFSATGSPSGIMAAMVDGRELEVDMNLIGTWLCYHVKFVESSCPFLGLPYVLYRVGNTPTVVYNHISTTFEDIYIQ
jgi:hypothetical protein